MQADARKRRGAGPAANMEGKNDAEEDGQVQDTIPVATHGPIGKRRPRAAYIHDCFCVCIRSLVLQNWLTESIFHTLVDTPAGDKATRNLCIHRSHTDVVPDRFGQKSTTKAPRAHSHIILDCLFSSHLMEDWSGSRRFTTLVRSSRFHLLISDSSRNNL